VGVGVDEAGREEGATQVKDVPSRPSKGFLRNVGDDTPGDIHAEVAALHLETVEQQIGENVDLRLLGQLLFQREYLREEVAVLLDPLHGWNPAGFQISPHVTFRGSA
jgi:hypothetical protein